MRTFTAVLPARPLLPHDLALLLAPVRANGTTDADPYVARADGVLLDDNGRVVAFILRLARKLDARGARTLVPTTAVTLLEGPELRLDWTEAQLREQPRLDQDLQLHDRIDDGAQPGGIAPSPTIDKAEVAKEGVSGGLIGGALGALAGLAIGGPIGIAGMAVFFATGGSLLGLISGASEKTPVGKTETSFEPKDASERDTLGVWLGQMEERLRDPEVESAGFVSKTQMVPMSTTAAVPPTPETPKETGEQMAEAKEAAPAPSKEAAGWR